MVSIHSEGTFGRLRYSFGGDRPSQTAHLTLSIHRFHGAMLEFQQQKSGIPTVAPREPESSLPRLPPILCIRYRNPISGYSQALRGLSVQSRVMGIFTHTSISPGPLLRQRSNRYTIRAGRNLPDKDRYSYGRRLLGLRFYASLAMTFPLNLPAPGRCQHLYVSSRFRRYLCFC